MPGSVDQTPRTSEESGASALLPGAFFAESKRTRRKVAAGLARRTASGARGREMIATWYEGGDPALIPALTEMVLRDPDAGVRLSAYQGLARMADASAVPALLEGMRDTDKRNRFHAAGALGRLRAREAVPGLIELLGDPYCGVHAADALVAIRDARGLEPIWQASRRGSFLRRRRLRRCAEDLAEGVGDSPHVGAR